MHLVGLHPVPQTTLDIQSTMHIERASSRRYLSQELGHGRPAAVLRPEVLRSSSNSLSLTRTRQMATSAFAPAQPFGLVSPTYSPSENGIRVDGAVGFQPC